MERVQRTFSTYKGGNIELPPLDVRDLKEPDWEHLHRNSHPGATAQNCINRQTSPQSQPLTIYVDGLKVKRGTNTPVLVTRSQWFRWERGNRKAFY